MSNTDIHNLAARIHANGNAQTAARLSRLAQSMDEIPMEDFNEAGEAPPIESYVRHQSTGSPSQMHTATVSFAAPQGVSEADIMEHILGIRDALDVKVEGFKWSVQDSKKQNAN